MGTLQTQLVESLKKIQSDNGLSDGQMGKLIGFSRQLYQKIRTYNIKVSDKVARGILNNIPALKQDAIYFLTGGANIETSPPDNHATHDETAQNGKLAHFIKKVRGFIK